MLVRISTRFERKTSLLIQNCSRMSASSPFCERIFSSSVNVKTLSSLNICSSVCRILS